MACYHPITAYRYDIPNANGRRPLHFGIEHEAKEGFHPIQIQCGGCVGCRLKRSLDWAIRCMHEAQCHDDNSFITLTYNKEHIPLDGSLDKTDFQKFMKRLRRANPKKKLKFYHCGEYGEKFARPHFHACLFNHDWPDRKLHSVRNGHASFTSETLNKLWSDKQGDPIGFSLVQDLTFESAAYAARYVMKKQTGDKAEDHYDGLQPEYNTMSLRPPIGAEWYQRYSADVFPGDHIIIKGKQYTVPRYYEQQYEIADPYGYAKTKQKREKSKHDKLHDNTPERLKTREKVKLAQIKSLERTYENGP